MIFLGVDVGATKTHALICDETGLVLGFGVAAGGNPEEVGYDGLSRAMQQAIHQALIQAGILDKEISAAGFGIAGYDWPHQFPEVLAAVQALHLPAKLVIENDAVLPILAGSSTGWGIAACAGTGNNVRGIDANGRSGRITGNSAALGEFGGASEIMQVVLQRLAWMWTGRIQVSSLANRLVADCGAADLGDLIEGLVAGRYRLQARQAPLVVQAAAEGDLVAQDVIRWNAEELAESVLAIVQQLNLADEEFEVVMSGHLFAGSELYRQAFQSRVRQFASKVQFQLLLQPPVIGAVLLAITSMGLDIQGPRTRLLEVDFAFIKTKFTPKNT